jgi:hypothetical protein
METLDPQLIVGTVAAIMPALAPLLTELLKRIKGSDFINRLPWWLKMIVTPVIGAAIGSLGDMATAGAVAGATGSVGYALARNKAPKK